MVDDLEFRKKKILKAIIKEHILTAQPIGSRTLGKKYDFGVSSATIRNEMADLEDLGYLEQPHTSAGRIPSDRGYRFYVDVLMDDKEYSPKQFQGSLEDLYHEMKGMQGIISETARMVSRLTRYATMVSEPRLEDSSIKKFQLIRVNSGSLLVVLITDTGIVNDKIIKLKNDLEEKQVRYMNKFLVEHLHGRKLIDIDDSFMNSLKKKLLKRVNLSQEFFTALSRELDKIAKSRDLRIYIGGTSYILEQPEFSDLETLKKVLNIFDEKERLRKLIADSTDDGLEVRIGHENELEEMQNCSLVLAAYSLGKRARGKIGVVGPTRMEYPRVISTVDFVSRVLGEIISEVSR
ncbi:MAG: heat-inducible transcriptional repressor HrcA [Halanaerobiales bacterium]